MAKFTDVAGRDWTIEFDGFLLDDIREETGIDLADLSAGGLFKIDQHMPSLIKVLAVCCQDEIKERNLSPREFARAIKGNVLRSALEAVLKAIESFFPPSSWSGIRSRLDQQREFSRQWSQVQPLLNRLNAPDMPEAMRTAVMQSLAEMMGSIDSPELDELMFAGGQAPTPSTPASDSPVSAESIPEDLVSASSG